LVSGPDQLKCLHNLTTADVLKLESAQGCEAFVTTPQGKTLAFVTLHRDAGQRWVLVRTDGAAMEALGAHIARYAIFDDVTVAEPPADFVEWHVLPSASDAHLLAELARMPEYSIERGAGDGAHAFDGCFSIRESPCGRPGLTIMGRSVLVVERLSAIGVDVRNGSSTDDLFEPLRIAAGWPVNGAEVTTDRLPQELGRDKTAIRFTKGCYLGQETVARLDALGHVNRLLRGLRIEGAGGLPAAGARLTVEDKDVGFVTSAAVHPDLGALALGFARSPAVSGGTRVQIEGVGTANVVEL
jgi:folate-binding protein YgfZ